MTKAHLTKIRSWLAVASLLFLAANIVSLQGGTEFVGRLLGEKAETPVANPPGIAYFGGIVGGGLFFLASIPFLLHVVRHGNRWHSRLPAVWLEDMDTRAWEAKVFQICVLLALVVAPMAGIVSCLLKAETGDICEQNTQNFYDGARTNLFLAPTAKMQDNQMRLRKAGADKVECTSGVELFPRSLTPVFLYIVPLAGLLMSTLGIFLLFIPGDRGRALPATASIDEVAEIGSS